MPRLRTLYVGTKTVGDVREEQHILVLDGLAPDHMKDLQGFERKALPPLLAFSYDVDIPEADALAEGNEIDITTHADAAQGHRVEIDVTGADAEFTKLIRKMTRTGHLNPQKPPLLVFARSVIDAGPMVDQLQRITDAEVTTVSATRHPTLPLGLVDPVIIRTPEYVALPDDHHGKQALEENLRRVAASS